MRTKVLWEESHAKEVQEKRDDFGRDHVRMPTESQHQLSIRQSLLCRLVTHQVVISSATINSSVRTSDVNEMATMLMNSLSNRTSERIMMAPPWKTASMK